MNEIARLLFLRPPAPAEPVVVFPSSSFAAALDRAHRASARITELKAVATALITSPQRVGTVDDLPNGRQLETVLDQLGENPTAVNVADTVSAVFGHSPARVVNAASWAADRGRIADNLIAAKLL